MLQRILEKLEKHGWRWLLVLAALILIVVNVKATNAEVLTCEVGDLTKGKWVSLGQVCKLPGATAEYSPINGVGYWSAIAIAGRYMQMEHQGIIWGHSSYTGFGCYNSFSGGPDTYYQCVPCPPYDFESGLRYTMDQRAPGDYAKWAEFLNSYPCLAAGFPPGNKPQMVVELRHSGRIWEWVGNAGVNSGYPCPASNIGQYYSKIYIGNPVGVIEAREWQCNDCTDAGCQAVPATQFGPPLCASSQYRQ